MKENVGVTRGHIVKEEAIRLKLIIPPYQFVRKRVQAR